MLCPTCGYWMDDRDVNCPRCARMRRDAEQQREVEQQFLREQEARKAAIKQWRETRRAEQQASSPAFEDLTSIEIDFTPARTEPGANLQPAAQSINQMPGASPPAQATSAPDAVVGKTCPFCQTPIKPGAPVVICSACAMPHHQECWQENGRCTTFGCHGIDPATANHAPVALPIQQLTPDYAPTHLTSYPPSPRAKRSSTGSCIIAIIIFIVFAILLIWALTNYNSPPTIDTSTSQTQPPSEVDQWFSHVATHNHMMNDAYAQLVAALDAMNGNADAPIGPLLAAAANLRMVTEQLPATPPDAAYADGYAAYCAGCHVIATGTLELDEDNKQWAEDIVNGQRQYRDGYNTMMHVHDDESSP